MKNVVRVKSESSLAELLEMNKDIKFIYESNKFILRLKKIAPLNEVIKDNSIIIVISRNRVLETPPKIKLFDSSLIEIMDYIKTKNIFLDIGILDNIKSEYVEKFKRFCVIREMYKHMIEIFLMECELEKKQ